MAQPRGRGFRWRVAALGLGAFSVLALLAFAGVMAGLSGPPGARPLALDFTAFWAAAQLATHGAAANAYNNILMEAFERAQTRMPSSGLLPFYYPPSFLLLCLPLGFLPYLWALLLFLAAQAVLLWSLTYRILVRAGGAGFGWVPVFAMPGILMNLFSGQTGGLSAACLAGAMLLLEDRPFLAGACLGALACKPQLAAVAPLALLAGRRWRALAGAAATAIAIAAASFLVLGRGAWEGFLANAPLARSDIESVPVRPFAQSVFAALRQAGVGLGASYAGQGLVALAALGLLLALCWRQRRAGPQIAALAVAALLITPYLNDYDLVVLAAPMAWLAGQAMRDGFLWGEKPLVLAVYLLPFAARAAELKLSLMLSPPLLFAFLVCLYRRALLSQHGPALREAP